VQKVEVRSERRQKMQISRLPFGHKLAMTLLLINVVLGLVFACVQMNGAIGMKDDVPGMSMADVRFFFQGDPDRSILEAVLQRPTHWRYATAAEHQAIQEWVEDGATTAVYEARIASIMEERCVRCHSEEGERAETPLIEYEDVLLHTELADPGVDYDRLASISYVNSVLLTCLSAVVAGLFFLTRFRGGWKQAITLLPFAAIFGNILSWWSAKQSAVFVHLAVASSFVFGAFILLMVVLTLLDLWILPTKKEE
jgi:hypothetical protein